MFSSVTSTGRFPNAGANAPLYASNTSVIGKVRNSILRFFASVCASALLPAEENGPGMETPSTLSAPKASTAMAATTAESIPPLRPTSTFLNPHLQTRSEERRVGKECRSRWAQKHTKKRKKQTHHTSGEE